MGHWPAERGHVRSARYANPAGFIAVTAEDVVARETRGGARTGRAAMGALAIAGSAALGAIQFIHPMHAPTRPFAAIAAAGPRLAAGASPNAFGLSHAVQLRFALPGDSVEFPLEVSGDLSALSYEWVSPGDSVSTDSLRQLNGASFVAPSKPGFYHLALIRGAERQIIPAPALAVMVPFQDKVGGMLNGYHIGTYVADRLTHHDHPAGFLEVREADVGLKVSDHLRLGDFLTHDRQTDVWPKYIALNPRLLDKLELVLAKVGEHARLSRPDAVSPDDGEPQVAFDVHSGFRTPAHNRSVWRSANDSRHEYGDAADVAIDADGDGRVTRNDEILVERAVDQVEEEHPELVGGLGLYTSRHYRTPYVHIDARGTRTRWKG